MGQLTTILIRKETRERLRKLGRKGESYDQIINRLITLLEEKNRREVKRK